MARPALLTAAWRLASTLTDAVTRGVSTFAGRLEEWTPGGRAPSGTTHGPDGIGDPGILAPWPQIDRYPIVMGPSASFQYVSAVKRQAKYGYRLQWVDLLHELWERDPSCLGNLLNRILATSSGRIEVKSASTNDELAAAVREMATPGDRPHPRADEIRIADEIAAQVQAQLNGIPERPQALTNLLWCLYYGPTCAEILWERRPEEWRVKRLHYVAPRRIAYPDQGNWHPHIWDQGLVVTSGPDWQKYLTSGLFGIDVQDYPNKFVVHTPNLLSGYPTEDGLGMALAYYMVLKIMAARGGGEYMERFIKPWALATYSSSYDERGVRSRNATPEDIAIANAAMKSLGLSGLAYATVPDSINVELFGPSMKGSAEQMTHTSFADWLDDQIARPILTTSALQQLKSTGARNALEVLSRGAKRVTWYDAVALSSTLTRDLGDAIVRLNHPGLEHLAPTILIHVDDEPGPDVMLNRIDKAARAGFPIDADKAAAAVGIGSLLADPKKADVRVLYPVKAIDVLPPQKATDIDEDEVDETADAAPDKPAPDEQDENESSEE